jgi:hypothetical protein
VGGTRVQWPWGENRGPEHGAAAFVDDPQPRDELTGPQFHQFGRVHLPDLVRSPGTERLGGGASPGRRGGQPGAPEPSLERPHGRQCVVGELMVQHHADQAGPPGRMLAAQAEGGLHERFGEPGCRRSASVVGRGQGVRVATTEAVQEMPDGARLQAEDLGDGGAILAILVASPDGLAHRHGKWTRHGPFSIKDAGRGIGPSVCPS